MTDFDRKFENSFYVLKS